MTKKKTEVDVNDIDLSSLDLSTDGKLRTTFDAIVQAEGKRRALVLTMRVIGQIYRVMNQEELELAEMQLKAEMKRRGDNE